MHFRFLLVFLINQQHATASCIFFKDSLHKPCKPCKSNSILEETENSQTWLHLQGDWKNLCLQTLGKPTNLIGTCHVEKALAMFCRLQLAVHWHRQSEYSYPNKVSISRHPSLFYVIIVLVCVCVCVWLLRVCILSSVCHTDTHREPEFSNLSLKPREKYLSKSRMPLSEVTVS